MQRHLLVARLVVCGQGVRTGAADRNCSMADCGYKWMRRPDESGLAHCRRCPHEAPAQILGALAPTLPMPLRPAQQRLSSIRLPPIHWARRSACGHASMMRLRVHTRGEPADPFRGQARPLRRQRPRMRCRAPLQGRLNGQVQYIPTPRSDRAVSLLLISRRIPLQHGGCIRSLGFTRTSARAPAIKQRGHLRAARALIPASKPAAARPPAWAIPATGYISWRR